MSIPQPLRPSYQKEPIRPKPSRRRPLPATRNDIEFIALFLFLSFLSFFLFPRFFYPEDQGHKRAGIYPAYLLYAIDSLGSTDGRVLTE
eukprot:1394081-Amorphochlora_amoeboformis.AAC.1